MSARLRPTPAAFAFVMLDESCEWEGFVRPESDAETVARQETWMRHAKARSELAERLGDQDLRLAFSSRSYVPLAEYLAGDE